LGFADAGGIKYIQIQGPHFNVLDTIFCQRTGRPLTAADNPLGANHAVVLVFDLQQVCVQLTVVTVFLNTNALVWWMESAYSAAQVPDILFQRIDGNPHRGLGLILVAQVTHPQRGGVGMKVRVLVEFMQICFTASQKRLAHRRRCPKQIQHQPARPMEVPDQPHVVLIAKIRGIQFRPQQLLIGLPEFVGKRKVEMHARDDLHHATVAMAQAPPVDVFHMSDIGLAKFGYGDVLIALYSARHACGPKQFIAQSVVHELVDITQKLAGSGTVFQRRCHQLQQGFGIIRRDKPIGQRSAKQFRMWRLSQFILRSNTQGFFFQSLARGLPDAWPVQVMQFLNSCCQHISHLAAPL